MNLSEWETIEIDPKEWGTTGEYAKEFNISRQRVNQLIHKGQAGECKLVQMPSGANAGGVWFIKKPFQKIDTKVKHERS